MIICAPDLFPPVPPLERKIDKTAHSGTIRPRVEKAHQEGEAVEPKLGALVAAAFEAAVEGQLRLGVLEELVVELVQPRASGLPPGRVPLPVCGRPRR